MATKKPPAPQKSSPQNQQSKSVKPTRLFWIIIILIFTIPLLIFAYNKYLDYKNVEDFNSLLTKLQEIEKTLEQQTKENISISTDCSISGEKFNENYSCSLFLLPEEYKLGDNTSASAEYKNAFLGLKNTTDNCSISEGGFYEGYGYCSFGLVRRSAIDGINRLIRDYTDCPILSCEMLN